MPRTRVKFCGITNVEDALAAAHFGADAIGLVFYPPAATAMDLPSAAAIVRALPPFITPVALFVNAKATVVKEVITTVRPALLQFHGDESAEECAQYGVPYIKACRARDRQAVAETLAEHSGQACGLLLDAAVKGQYGGSGQLFDWNLIPKESPLRLIVAGGLTAATVGDLIRHHQPFAVDVSSGIAADDKRRKNWDKMRKFMETINNA